MARAEGELRFEPAPDLVQILKEATRPVETKDGWQLLAKRGDEKKGPVVDLKVLRTLFPADRPYRCLLGGYQALVTTAGGVVNVTYNLNTIATAVSSEWSTIAALFDQCYVHRMILKFTPINDFKGTGAMLAGAGAVSGPTTSGSGNYTIGNCGLIGVELYGSISNYSTASAMLNNPTRKFRNSGDTWNMEWRNNGRFDPRGQALTPLTAIGWQGWCEINEVSNLGGGIQIRAANDELIGDKAHVVTLGDVAVMFDVSFRARV